MEETKQFSTDTDFLHDKQFILWILTGDDKLGQYWKKFLDAHPEYADSFDRAVKHSSHLKLNQARLSDEEHEALRLRVHASLRAIERKRKQSKFVWRGAAICVLIIGAIVYLSRSEEKTVSVAGEEPIAVWAETLDDEDIRFVRGDSIVAFTENIRLQMSQDGSALVLRADEEAWIAKKVGGEGNKLVVPYGKRSKVRLEDGTEVWLNSGSTLKFPTHFSGKTREVTLAGEMYIEVAADSVRPFIVHTDWFDIQVYGTKFNVSVYGEDALPYCVLIEGSVVIHPKWGSEMKMEKDEQVTYCGQQLMKRKVRPSKYTCWKDGYLELDDTSLTDVLRQLERYYNLSFEYKNKAHLNGKKASGKIYLSENTSNTLLAISLLYSVDFTFPTQDDSP